MKIEWGNVVLGAAVGSSFVAVVAWIKCNVIDRGWKKKEEERKLHEANKIIDEWQIGRE